MDRVDHSELRAEDVFACAVAVLVTKVDVARVLAIALRTHALTFMEEQPHKSLTALSEATSLFASLVKTHPALERELADSYELQTQALHVLGRHADAEDASRNASAASERFRALTTPPHRS